MEETAVRENQQEEVIRVRPKDLARESDLLADYLQRLPSLVARGLVYLVILFVLIQTNTYSEWGKNYRSRLSPAFPLDCGSSRTVVCF